MTLAVRGLTLVISDKPDVERDAVADVWSAAGGDVLRLGRFWDPPALHAARVRVYGADTFAQVLAQRLGLSLSSPPDDVLVRLSPTVTKRAVRACALAAAATIAFPSFVKSFIPKLIRSRVYASLADLLAETHGLEPDVELVVSEVVFFLSEVRAWTLDGEVCSIACYEGSADLADARMLASAVAQDPSVPAACVIDVGLTTDRGWVVIETNAAWGAGLNGCEPLAAAACIARATSAAAR